MGSLKINNLGDRIYRIKEPKGVSEYLIVGAEKALLIDTGYGKKELVKTIRQITDLPLIVVNSHFHPDHSAGNGFFPEIFVGPEDIPNGEPNDTDLLIERINKNNKFVSKIISLYFRNSNYGSCKYSPLTDGAEFYLGNRIITCHKFSGHTKGSFMFSDSMTKTLFTGDCCNPGTWLFINPSLNFREYTEKIARAYDDFSDIKKLCFSHFDDCLDTGFFKAYSEFLANINNCSVKEIKLKSFSSPLCLFSSKIEKYGKVQAFIFRNQIN